MSGRVMHGNLTLVTPPQGDPVSVPDAKDQARVLHAAEDLLVESLIEAATAHLDGRDGILGRALMTQTWDYTLPCFPVESCIPLPLAPVQSIVSITYRDPNGSLLTFAGANYALSADRHWNPKVQLAVGASWPGTRDEPDAVKIQAVYGYTQVPMPIRHAITLLVAHWFANREPVNVGNITSELPFGVQALLAPYMRTSF